MGKGGDHAVRRESAIWDLDRICGVAKKVPDLPVRHHSLVQFLALSLSELMFIAATAAFSYWPK